MSRRSAFAIFTVVISAFAVMAAHLGTIDHSMHMAGSVSTPMLITRDTSYGPAVPHEAASMSPVHTMTSTRGMPTPRPNSGGMSMVMLCGLMVLATVLRAVVRKLATSGRLSVVSVLAASSGSKRPQRGLRPARPPGLSMLCVVRC